SERIAPLYHSSPATRNRLPAHRAEIQYCRLPEHTWLEFPMVRCNSFRSGTPSHPVHNCHRHQRRTFLPRERPPRTRPYQASLEEWHRGHPKFLVSRCRMPSVCLSLSPVPVPLLQIKCLWPPKSTFVSWNLLCPLNQNFLFSILSDSSLFHTNRLPSLNLFITLIDPDGLVN